MGHKVGLAAITGAVLVLGWFTSPRSSLFERACRASNVERGGTSPILRTNADGTIRYLYDDFTGYGGRQRLLDGFERLGDWDVPGQTWLSAGRSSQALAVRTSASSPELRLDRRFPAPVDLSRWDGQGYLTLWLRAEEPEGVDQVVIEFEDQHGRRRLLSPLANPPAGVINSPLNDPELADLPLVEGQPGRDVWADFGLAAGWNYLLWRLDRDGGDPGFDSHAVVKIRLRVGLRPGLYRTLAFDDLRIQDGLQRHSNPTGGFWSPPFGRPQYGVYDLDEGGLRLLNVRSAQYPSNGDHGRMLTSAPVPEDFAFRVEFTLEGLGDDRRGTWFRVTYDFEPEHDAGHEWFGAFLSLEYERFGLAAVWPVVVKKLVGEEPAKGDPRCKKPFVARAGQRYALEMVVRGQQTIARLSEVHGKRVIPKVTVGHVFERPRHGTEARYPLAIEATGNLNAVVHKVESVQLREAVTGL